MPSAPSRPWKMFLPLGIVLLLALCWSIYWFVAIGFAKQRFAAERLHLSTQGITLSCSEENWGGFPFRFEYGCSTPGFIFDGRIEIQPSNLLVVALAYAPWQAVALIDGPTRIRAAGTDPDHVEHGRAIAALTLDRTGTASLSAEVGDVIIPALGSLEKLTLHTRPSPLPEGGTDIAITVIRPSCEVPGEPAFSLDQASFLGTLQSGRKLAVERVELQQGSVRYWGSGLLSLDSENRISGKLDTETNNTTALLDGVAPYLRFTEQQRAGLQTMLGVLGNEAKVSLIATDGALYLGPFRMAVLPPLY